MSTLSALIQADDSPAPAPRSNTPETVKTKGPETSTSEETPADPIDEILAGRSGEGHEISETPLGIAVDNFMTNWNQLLLLINTTVGHSQPSLDHVKEVAECSAKNLKDACLELSGEFTRASLQWRLSKREEALDEEAKELKIAIGRQQTLIARTEGIISSHLGDFANASQSGS